MNARRLPALAVLLVILATSALAQAPAVATPDTLGMSAERLQRINTVMRDYVERGRIGGTVSLVLRGGRMAHLEAAGWLDREQQVPMRPDAIFRAASMSKAVTSVAVVMLIEEGRLMLGEPVSRYIPAFKDSTVAVPGPAGRFGVVPARREITIRDLLTHTAGISYGQAPSLAADQYKAAGVQGWYFADKAEPVAAVIDRLAKLPFDAQPGERYVYGFNTDILGVVVEKVSGLTLDRFFQTRIFDP